ncbi:MAG TPA: CoA transferase [Acidimicrobiales bacterium]|jgi:crotonobetainyl-CoA:carnitine CoA-transferase CaiB-like acyl-CoA transferase
MRVLEDVRILSLEQFGAGPYATVHLADLGADVIKIEDPALGGDVGRYVPPFQEEEDSLFFETFNRNKRSFSLNITSAAGRKVFDDLVRHSDVVFSNLRGDVPAKIKITYNDLKHLNPAIVCCNLSGFGMTGPLRSEPGYDYIFQGMAGWMDLTGDPDGPPTKSGLSVVDFSGGLVAAMAILAGLHAARRDGVGSDCDVSLFDTALSMLTYPAAWYLNGGLASERTRHSAHPSIVPFQAFETANGWMVVACAKEKFWQRLCVTLGRPEWSDDERFNTFVSRRENKDVLIPLLEELFVREDTSHWLATLKEVGVPCGPVNTLAEALEEPQALARDMIVTTEHPRFGEVRQVASPVNVGARRIEHRRAPLRNEDAHDILSLLLGYDDEAITEFMASGEL